jgi:predicted RNase H-like HicB family nuclease/predicted RNA binding protein YcfA (HicA-like mRNA interferase family)
VPKKYREVRAALQEAGWEVLRRRGSHEVWGKPGEPARIVVAGKESDTVPVGTLSSISSSKRPGASPMSEYVVVFERAEDGGWGAYLPDFPGVVALGASREEVASRIQEALDVYAREQTALGRRLPDPIAATGTIEAA